jgi:polysaccharide biosynthesis protein PslG
MDHLARAGVRPMFILDYGNRLYDHGQSPRSDSARAAFARLAAAAARHFRGQGVIWEIWNEPNIAQFWKPEPDAQAYSWLALEATRAVRTADPDAVILAPGSSELPWKFLETIFAAGLLEHIDAVSVHPYREQPPETAGADYGRLRALIARYASPARRLLPIVSSEWGYSTAEGAVSEARQADYLSRQWLANLATGVNVSIFYDWRDDGNDARDREHRFGTVRRNLEPKPSFLAAQALIRSLQGYTFRHCLQGYSLSDWKLLFQKADEPAAMVVDEWSAQPRGNASRQTPHFHRVGADDPDAAQLRRLAGIRFVPGPMVESQGYPATLELSVVNPEREPARVHLVAKAIDAPGQATLDVTLKPGQRPVRSLILPSSTLRLEHRQVSLGLSWNNETLPAITPLDVWRADPLLITAAPRGQSLEVTLENPARGSFSGKLMVRADGENSDGPAVQIGKGQAQAHLRLPLQTGIHQVLLVDGEGSLVAQSTAARYQPMSGFPAGPEPSTELDAILFVDNSPRPPRPLTLTAASADAPAPLALEVPYHFDPGWRYLTVAPRRPLAIPAEAQAAIVWVHGNESGDLLRCRFHDATGQTFQPDMGRLDWSGWRPLRIELRPHSATLHWGGAGDGTPHLPLNWEALLLIDSAHRDRSGPQSILVASPFYVLDR